MQREIKERSYEMRKADDVLLSFFQRMSICAALHQGDNSNWIDGKCVTPTTATREAQKALYDDLVGIVDRIKIIDNKDAKLRLVGAELLKYELAAYFNQGEDNG